MGDDDSIEILEVVGMEDDPGVPSGESARDTPGDASEPAIEILEEDGAGATGSGSEGDRLRELLLHSRADFDNYRKRMAREMQRARGNATADLLGTMLPVLDNLERALGTGKANHDALRQGVEMIHQQLTAAMNQAGLSEVNPLGEKFDPHVHEAMTMVDGAGSEAGTILEVMQKGYMVNDRLLRPAMVKVASGKKPGSVEPGGRAAG
jgi:molecular chaperone GrpE